MMGNDNFMFSRPLAGAGAYPGDTFARKEM